VVLNNLMRIAPIDISATNIRGMGAVRLVESLLPSLERIGADRIGRIWLPDGGPLASYGAGRHPNRYRIYRRFLPNAISRILECTLLSGRVGRGRPVLILGDIPVRGAAKQVVFVHSPFIVGGSSGSGLAQRLKGEMLRSVFRANLRWVDAVIVQTQAMRSALGDAYPELREKIHIVSQPAPRWLLGGVSNETPRKPGGLRLFYPAAGYPHKNHALIRRYANLPGRTDAIESITVTVEQPAGEAATALRYLGQIEPAEVMRQYAACDALLFPSLDESYGLPLVEAMHLGLPIVAADRPYAHVLCGEGAIYFDPTSDASLAAAIDELAARLSSGWRPDWSAQLADMPRDWDEVAARMLAVFDSTGDSA
jgi:hypothetical protein